MYLEKGHRQWNLGQIAHVNSEMMKSHVQSCDRQKTANENIK